MAFVPEKRADFVPEGQADSSQARSAWAAMQRGPVPKGRPKSWSVPQIFVVETEPRHEQATARRMLMPHAASETPGLPVEKFGSDDVRPDFGWNEWFLATARRSHSFCLAIPPKNGQSRSLCGAHFLEMSKLQAPAQGRRSIRINSSR
jgi:hypothetical protein